MVVSHRYTLVSCDHCSLSGWCSISELFILTRSSVRYARYHLFSMPNLSLSFLHDPVILRHEMRTQYSVTFQSLFIEEFGVGLHWPFLYAILSIFFFFFDICPFLVDVHVMQHFLIFMVKFF